MFFEDLVAKMFKHHNHSIIATYEREGFALIAKARLGIDQISGLMRQIYLVDFLIIPNLVPENKIVSESIIET